MWLVAQRAGHHLLHEVRGDLQSILAQRHRRGASMGLHACHGAIKPPDAQHALHYTNGNVVVLQHRTLFDMSFKIRTNRVVTRLLGANVTNACQFFFHRFTFCVFGSIGMLKREGLGEHARAHHHWHEARAFFVGPKSDLNRRFGFDAVVV